jgi:hypothetical protein
LTTHNRQKSIPSVGFEPTISAGERPQTQALDRAAAGAGTGDLNGLGGGEIKIPPNINLEVGNNGNEDDN